MKYYDAGIFEWRFGYDADNEWMQSCMDDAKYDKFVNGVDPNKQKTPAEYTQETHFFCWQFQDKLPYEKQFDDAFYTSKHGGDYLTVRESKRQHRFVIIWKDKKSGRDCLWQSYTLDKLNAEDCRFRNLDPRKFVDTWWHRGSAIALHPDFRNGKFIHIMNPYVRDLFKRNHFPPIETAGTFMIKDVWTDSQFGVEKTRNKGFHKDVSEVTEKKDIIDSLMLLLNSGALGEPQNSPFIEPKAFNTAREGQYRAMNLRWETPQEREEWRKHPILGPMFNFFIDFHTDVGYDENGKIGVLYDPSISLKQYMLNHTGDQTWVDETFV